MPKGLFCFTLRGPNCGQKKKSYSLLGLFRYMGPGFPFPPFWGTANLAGLPALSPLPAANLRTTVLVNNASDPTATASAREHAMSRESNCRCLICDLEGSLAIEAAEGNSGKRYRAFAQSSALLSPFPAASDLVAFLHTRPPDNGISRSDRILSELLASAAIDSDPALRNLLLLVFIPMLHATSSRVATRNTSLSVDDISQHVVLSLLEILGSPEFYRRSSHVAFAISRALKRRAFEWAARETRRAVVSEGKMQGPDALMASDTSETFERLVVLRHFLDRCHRQGLLSGEDLDLLVHFKLDAARYPKPDGPAAVYSNASRQRMKRLLGKLRRIARKPADTAQLRLF
jgi:hypothetical protein